jgi:Nuclear pore complex scaffold, nucleoporins 186/192/205
MTGEFDNIKSIHERLDVSAAVHWKRQDIWGVLAASYAIAILPISSVLTSPRATSSSSTIKRTWKACLTASSDYKSFTFVHLSLLPALKNYGTKIDCCELPQFLISVLADFISYYLDVVCTCNAIPFSRSKWEENETKRLIITREGQERNRSFHQTYSGGYNAKDILEHVDLMKRPDCIDDIVAVAIDVCSQGPDYAVKFWASEEFIDHNGSKNSTFVPSRTLKMLEAMQDKDRSLTPIYFSLLAVLASVKPSIIFDIVNSKYPSFKVSFNWTTIFETLRWYVRQMRDGFSGEAANNSKFEDQDRPPRGYYYGVEDNNIDVASNLTTLSPTPSNSGLDELNEMHMSIVLSHLALIRKVATNCASGRAILADMNLQGNQRDDKGDSVLMVLFSLAIAPLTPQLRGAALATLAALLKIDGTNQKERTLICNLARKAWDLLELSQIVPVLLLNQYHSKNTEGLTQVMTFPPSSLSLVS